MNSGDLCNLIAQSNLVSCLHVNALIVFYTLSRSSAVTEIVIKEKVEKTQKNKVIIHIVNGPKNVDVQQSAIII